ncbi:uncharacterized protein LAESUDRAFT_732968 [Laetiporus sulphureus 93-53]|uniref:Uncharacterized protein n=1 Tax=Laetiporus sulphureus 93-53 TaxID=1314785 RepID=A0A165AUJ9_9APHY|nr:uncharacterized protein LAESUDRAFT_732968 [Laetiporus sulphureus 93-53]KZS99688.1 hypothetical protein LAESUDRAFT_732968 [Laetiporus sulphureus 93-53]
MHAPQQPQARSGPHQLRSVASLTVFLAVPSTYVILNPISSSLRYHHLPQTPFRPIPSVLISPGSLTATAT